MSSTERYDLVICGGGIAGLSLARQIQLSRADLSILILERLPRPLPEAAFKVGESTIETGAFYYGKVLELEDYLDAEQLPKLGLRYFFKGSRGNGCLADRPEYGTARFLPAKSYQLDRGKLENYFRGLLEQNGVKLKEGVLVRDIEINEQSDHTVIYQDGHELRTAKARWVVDALGRRRFLQRKLGLRKESEGEFNAVWFRVKGRIAVQDFVPANYADWHTRVEEDRWLSTNHLMGKGYWVWLIPLAPDNTSVGIVATEKIHPFRQYNTYEKAVTWLEQNEPLVAHSLQGRDILDFMRLKNYSYTSRQVFSIDRWCCIGEAATFADPYYSVGSNMIAFANGFTKRFIELDREGRLTPEYVDYANRFFLVLNDALTDTIHRAWLDDDRPSVLPRAVP
jgi:flavin-dependent dehydrogenase